MLLAVHSNLNNATTWVAILANPYSGMNRNRRLVDELAAALLRHGLEAHIVWDKDDRRRLLGDKQLGDWCCCIVAAGGDGSLNDVINELHQGGAHNVPLAVLPLGNENLFARQFGYSQDMQGLAGAIARGKIRRIDLGKADDRLFSLMVGVGLDGQVISHLAQWRAQRRGLKRVNRWRYLPRLLGAFFKYDYPMLHVNADGCECSGAHVLVFNLPQYGMMLDNLAPPGLADDGLLDWLVFKKPGRWAAIVYAVAVMRGRHLSRPDVVHGQAQHVHIRCDVPAPVQLDGDPADSTPVQVRVCPGTLRIIDMA